MQLLNHGLLGVGVVDLDVEPLVVLVGRREDVREDEVEEGLELAEVVLQRRPRQQEVVHGVEAPDGGAEDGNRT